MLKQKLNSILSIQITNSMREFRCLDPPISDTGILRENEVNNMAAHGTGQYGAKLSAAIVQDLGCHNSKISWGVKF